MNTADQTAGAHRRSAAYNNADGESEPLKVLASQRGYVVRGDSQLWLEWDNAATPTPADPALLDALTRLRPFEPFRHPSIQSFSIRGGGASIPEPSFLSASPFGAVNSADPVQLAGFNLTRDHTRELAGQLVRDEEQRAVPSALGWLIAYRDALVLDLQRCATRLVASPLGRGTEQTPLGGALAVVKVWLAEAVLASEPRETSPAPFLSTVASTVWESFKSGGRWGDEAWLGDSASFVDRLRVPGLDPGIVDSTLHGLGHHARSRDRITDPARDVWARLKAAERVLHAALRGTPMNHSWLRDAARQQQQEDYRRKQAETDAREQETAVQKLRATLLDDQARLPYIMNVLMPAALADPRSRSKWKDAHALYVEDLARAGLTGEDLPYPDSDALKAADYASRKRERDKKMGGA